eukprot:g6551.t1
MGYKCGVNGTNTCSTYNYGQCSFRRQTESRQTEMSEIKATVIDKSQSDSSESTNGSDTFVLVRTVQFENNVDPVTVAPLITAPAGDALALTALTSLAVDNAVVVFDTKFDFVTRMELIPVMGVASSSSDPSNVEEYDSNQVNQLPWYGSQTLSQPSSSVDGKTNEVNFSFPFQYTFASPGFYGWCLAQQNYNWPANPSCKPTFEKLSYPYFASLQSNNPKYCQCFSWEVLTLETCASRCTSKDSTQMWTCNEMAQCVKVKPHTDKERLSVGAAVGIAVACGAALLIVLYALRRLCWDEKDSFDDVPPGAAVVHHPPTQDAQRKKKDNDERHSDEEDEYDEERDGQGLSAQDLLYATHNMRNEYDEERDGQGLSAHDFEAYQRGMPIPPHQMQQSYSSKHGQNSLSHEAEESAVHQDPDDDDQSWAPTSTTDTRPTAEQAPNDV